MDPAPALNAAERFRQAVDRRDVDGMADALAPDVRLHSPTLWPPVEGRERARMIFGVLEELFEDFHYSHVLAGAPVDDRPGTAWTQGLVFRCRIGTQALEGVDLLDVDENDEVAALTVFVRPLAGLQALSEAMAARLARPPAS